MTGDDLYKIRTELNLSRKQLGDRFGVDKITIWRWESERSDLPVWVPLALQTIVGEGK